MYSSRHGMYIRQGCRSLMSSGEPTRTYPTENGNLLFYTVVYKIRIYAVSYTHLCV